MRELVTVDPAGVHIPDPTDEMHGTLLAWRWEDQEKRQWKALVRFRGGRKLQYEQWVDGQHLQRLRPR